MRNLVSRSQRFRRDEDGALIIFALVLFLLMAMMGGVAIDIMRYEIVRTDLQNPLGSVHPDSFTDPEALKVIVLMTDGEHFAEERVNAAYKSGPSDIYKSNNDGNYSIYHASLLKYWVPHLGTFQSAPWTNSTNSGTYTRQSWPQVWSAMRLSYVAWQFYARALGSTSSARSTEYTNRMDAFRSKTPTTSMDSQLQQICGLAKGQGVIAYGIAFEAPTNGQTQIRNCSTSAAHYFNASGLQIRTAFRAIASNISQLRLTQ